MALYAMYRAINGSLPTQIVGGITATAQTIEVEDASVLPDAPNLMTISTEDGAEVVRYGAKTGNVLGECLRGFDGTSPQIWPAGTVCYRAYTAYDHNAFVTNVEGLGAEVEGLAETKQNASDLGEGAFADFGAEHEDVARGDHTHAEYLTAETDPSVPLWAKAAQKPAYTYAEIEGTPDLAPVATSGSYNDLSNKPTIPALPTFAAVAMSGDYDDLSNKPTIPVLPVLAPVATSGNYTDLTNRPAIPSTAADVGASPSDHTHPAYEDRLDALETATAGIEALLAAI